MNVKQSRTYLIIVSLAGVLFSGYLTIGKLFTGSCPITEGCPYFLGYPACIYGLIMFSAILITAWCGKQSTNKTEQKKWLQYTEWVSIAGILFSGYFSAQELLYPSCLIKPCTYTLLLPTCVYGLVMYVLAWWIVQQLKKD